MAWRADLRTSSFRGVPFHVDQGTVGAGRRLARHEYPQRDIPYLEDMGRKAREYKVEAYIIGTDYMAGRDALLAAIEEAGAGQLVHPYHGTLQVTASDCQLTESTQHGGLAKFSITFVEAGQQQEPTTGVDTEGVLDAQYDVCEAAFADDFAQSFSVANMPEFAVRDALDSANSLLALPEMSLGNLSWIRSNPLSALTSLLPENLFGSLRDPLSLATGILALVRRAESVMGLFSFSRPPVSAAFYTPTRMAQSSNRSSFTSLAQQAATARRIMDMAKSEPATLEDARIARSEIVYRADAVLLDENTGQRSADAIMQLRTDAVSHFSQMQPSLPNLVSLTPQAVRPAMVVAHEFYGDDWLDAGRADELLSRNDVRHPGFVPAGSLLELIS